MKPKTKLQMEIVNGSRKLAPVSEAQKRYAYKHCFVHYFKRDAKGNCFCLDCGHTWRDKEDKKNCKCPHCGMNLKLENSRKRTAVYKEYFCVITTYKQYQVIRFFMVDCRLKKGSPANYFIIEAVQCWMNKEGKTETLSLLRGMSIFYYDAWIYGSSLELRKRNVHHDRIYDICPAVIYPRMKVIPELTRNGFKGAFYDICPSSFFMTLLTDNRMEILYKAGQMNLFLRFLERKYGIDKYWTYVKICLRHDYVIHDADLWLDYVDMLIENKLDARNPHYLCPLNVEEAHDWVMGKCKKKYSEKDEKDYIAAKSRFFNLSFADGNIMVRVLESLSDFYKEGKLLHHCVFSNAYYKREDSLIMSATVDGRRMETVEFSLSRMEVCQCRGKSNQLSAYHDRILNLVRDYVDMLIENKLDARNPHYLCPLNVEEAHDWVMGKCKKKYSEKDEKDYIAAKSRFFNLSFADGNIMVRVLESLSDFYKEGKLLHHCVFSNAYYKREDSLIMSATVDGRRMETVEFSLSRMEVCQCRGKSNQLSAYHDRILNLVRDNIPLIRERMVV